MYQPRKSILEMFDPLMVNPPSTPKREESDASPDNSDKENDAPRDPLSLSQYFNRTYHVKDLQQPFTPKGKLIDLGDVSIRGESEVASLGSSGVATEVQPGSGDALRPPPPTTNSYDDRDTEPATSPPSNGPFATPQNRRILGDIGVEELRPPKPPVKQGALKISFLTVPTSGSPPAEGSTTTAPPSGPEPGNTVPGPVITLYPPTFDSIPPTSSAPQISDKIDGYLSSQLPLSRTTTFAHRRSPLSPEHTSHRVSMDLQSSFQLHLQNGEYSFNLINDKVSFLESSQELSFPQSDDDSDPDQIVEDISVDDMFKSLTLQDEATVAAKRIFTPTAEKFSITSTSGKDTESSPKSETSRAVTPVLASPPQDVSDTCVTTDTLNVGRSGSTRHHSTTSRSSIPGQKQVIATSKPPMRVLVPPTKRPSSISSAQRTSVIRPPGRVSSTMGTLPRPVATQTRTLGKQPDGPRRVLLQASDKPTSQPVPARTISAPMVQGPQRVLVRTVPPSTNPIKKPLAPSSSANPPGLTSRLPGPSRIAVPSNLKPATRTSGISRPAGRWV